jgi:hypothetical protein
MGFVLRDLAYESALSVPPNMRPLVTEFGIGLSIGAATENMKQDEHFKSYYRA